MRRAGHAAPRRPERGKAAAGENPGRASRLHERDPNVVTSRLTWRQDCVTRRGSLTLRYITISEMSRLLTDAGFSIEALYGDCLGAPFEESSTEQVWVARRASRVC